MRRHETCWGCVGGDGDGDGATGTHGKFPISSKRSAHPLVHSKRESSSAKHFGYGCYALDVNDALAILACYNSTTSI